MTKEISCQESARLLLEWEDILVLTHASPDGDTLGSGAALVRGLRKLGKRARLALEEPPAKKFQYLLDGVLEGQWEPQHVMTVDVADKSLLGRLREKWEEKIELAVDHHGTHVDFAQRKWVEPESAATTELIYLLLQELGVPLDRETANAVYTGLTTDTGCFRYRNVTPRTHRIAAAMIEAGADAGEINRRMFELKSKQQLEAERRVMDSIRFSCKGKCAMVFLPKAIYEETGAKENELEGVASLPRQIEGVVIGVTLKEKENGEVKASVRTNLPADAAELCGRFGGGGHKGAAGCSFRGLSLEEAGEKLERACEAYLEELEK